jgi:hypothetical protein
MLNADLRDGIGRPKFINLDSGRIEIFGLVRISQWNINGDLIAADGDDFSLRHAAAVAADPGLPAAVADERVHVHQVHPRRRRRPTDGNGVADGKAIDLRHRERGRAKGHIRIGDLCLCRRKRPRALRLQTRGRLIVTGRAIETPAAENADENRRMPPAGHLDHASAVSTAAAAENDAAGADGDCAGAGECSRQ